MARLDTRAALARDLARVNAQLACVSLDSGELGFASEMDRQAFSRGLERARREVTAAELAVHDLVFGVRVTA